MEIHSERNNVKELRLYRYDILKDSVFPRRSFFIWTTIESLKKENYRIYFIDTLNSIIGLSNGEERRVFRNMIEDAPRADSPVYVDDEYASLLEELFDCRDMRFSSIRLENFIGGIHLHIGITWERTTNYLAEQIPDYEDDYIGIRYREIPIDSSVEEVETRRLSIVRSPFRTKYLDIPEVVKDLPRDILDIILRYIGNPHANYVLCRYRKWTSNFRP